MEKREGFYTLKGYQNGEAHNMTASMEDYLEMICRLLLTEEVVRVNQLAHMLHVKPSSASKMVKNLRVWDISYLKNTDISGSPTKAEKPGIIFYSGMIS